MKRILLQYDIAHGRLPRPERILEQACFLKEYGLTGIMLYLDGEGAQESLPVRGAVPADYLETLKKGLRKLGLEFVPHIQTLGHLERLLARPEMERWRDDPAGGRVVRIDLPEVRAGMKRYIAEVSELFDSEYVHCGGDEASTLGLGLSRNYLSSRGLENALAEYWNDLHHAVRSLNRKMVLYADELIAYPALRRKLEPEIVIANWGYCAADEVFESENHHYSAHCSVCSGRGNWMTGNAMAEYVFLPLPRLQENLRILEELGGRSGADTFVISDWGSYENINPMLNTALGSLFILRRLREPAYGMDDFLAEISLLIFGRRHPRFLHAAQIMFEAQSMKYWPPEICRWGPVFPRFLAGDPDTRSVITLAAVTDPDRLGVLKRDLAEACAIVDSLPETGVLRPQWLSDLKGIARRMHMTALRAELCRRHAWYAGAVWVTEKERGKLLEDYRRYRALAEQDLQWHKMLWRRDCLPGGLEESCEYLNTAVESAGKALHCPENTLLYFPPEK